MIQLSVIICAIRFIRGNSWWSF